MCTVLYADSFFVDLLYYIQFISNRIFANVILQMWSYLLLASYWFACLHCNTTALTGWDSSSRQLW
jgi:hypothetical protein